MFFSLRFNYPALLNFITQFPCTIAILWNYKLFFRYFDLVHHSKPGGTGFTPHHSVLPHRCILNNTKWPLHVAVHKDAVITFPIYYLVSLKWSDPLTYLDFVRLPDPQSLSLTSKLKLRISENSNVSRKEKKLRSRGDSSRQYDHSVYVDELYTHKRQHISRDIKDPVWPYSLLHIEA